MGLIDNAEPKSGPCYGTAPHQALNGRYDDPVGSAGAGSAFLKARLKACDACNLIPSLRQELVAVGKDQGPGRELLVSKRAEDDGLSSPRRKHQQRRIAAAREGANSGRDGLPLVGSQL